MSTESRACSRHDPYDAQQPPYGPSMRTEHGSPVRRCVVKEHEAQFNIETRKAHMRYCTEKGSVEHLQPLRLCKKCFKLPCAMCK